MAILTKEELLAKLTEYAGDNKSDIYLSLMEDISDTVDDFENRKTDEEWEKKYYELDDEWRRRYSERFLNEPIKTKEDEDIVVIEIEDGQKTSFDDLFEEREG